MSKQFWITVALSFVVFVFPAEFLSLLWWHYGGGTLSADAKMGTTLFIGSSAVLFLWFVYSERDRP